MIEQLPVMFAIEPAGGGGDPTLVSGWVVAIPQDGCVVRLPGHDHSYLAGRPEHYAGDITHKATCTIPLTLAPRGWA